MKIISKDMDFEISNSRYDIIRRKVEGKKVLDIGCVNHEAISQNSEFWLHKFVKKYAKNLIGMDYNKEEVEKLKKMGYKVFFGDAQDFKFEEKFDVIIAGELIEHLPNPGNFLQCCKNSITESGIIVLTTPNAFSIRNILRGILLGRVPTNDEHTCWFTPITLKRLCEINGLYISEGYYFLDPLGSTNSTRKKYVIERIASAFRKEYAPNILLVIRKYR
jgi:2-polyprenyl-3-methyl-5-hydroxy-6-metoxy-1,4-benzoquinol methylase